MCHPHTTIHTNSSKNNNNYKLHCRSMAMKSYQSEPVTYTLNGQEIMSPYAFF